MEYSLLKLLVETMYGKLAAIDKDVARRRNRIDNSAQHKMAIFDHDILAGLIDALTELNHELAQGWRHGAAEPAWVLRLDGVYDLRPAYFVDELRSADLAKSWHAGDAV